MPNRRFSHPPLVEVVCGVLFEPMAELDPVVVGPFWASIQERFPRRQILPALRPQRPGDIVLDLAPLPPLRTWLISADDTRVVQIQSDRVYFNWRKVNDAAYPSFNGGDGQGGLLAEVREELAAFAGYLQAKLGIKLLPQRVEMSMFDVLVQGRHWKSVTDLCACLPSMAPFLRGADALPAIQVFVEGPSGSGERRTAIQKVTEASTGRDAIRMETTVRSPVRGIDDVEPALKQAHGELKRAFDELIPPDQHHRFDEVEHR